MVTVKRPSDQRPCTCHPSEAFVPCRRQYAFWHACALDAEKAAHAETQERLERAQVALSDEERKKIAAFNILLTSVNPTIRMLAERALDNIEGLKTFEKFLREHPLRPAEVSAEDTDGREGVHQRGGRARGEKSVIDRYIIVNRPDLSSCGMDSFRQVIGPRISSQERAGVSLTYYAADLIRSGLKFQTVASPLKTPRHAQTKSQRDGMQIE